MASQDIRNRETCTFFGTQPTLTWKTAIGNQLFHFLRSQNKVGLLGVKCEAKL